MRRLNDISIQVEDRLTPSSHPGTAHPRPTLAGKKKTGGKSAAKAGSARQQIRRRWVPPVWWKWAKRGSLALLSISLLAVGPVWLTRSASGTRLIEVGRTQAIALSARSGFKVEEIFVEGRNRTPREELVAALGIQRGDPIFGIDLIATRQRLEEISWVKKATLERRLPGEVHLLIAERDPIALWQNQGHYYLVDHDGLVVGDQIDDFASLPLIVGEGAPDHAAALLDMLSHEPSLQSRVKSAQWISGRRWNLTLDNPAGGIDVRLPEENPVDALHDLAKLDQEHSLLERKVTVIDMRLPDRLVLRTVGGAEESAPTNGKHKPGKDA